MKKLLPVVICALLALSSRAAEKVAGARDKSGAPVGDYKIMGEAGATQAEGKFTKGKLDGVWMFYDSRHVKIAVISYIDGVRMGPFRTFFGSLRFPEAAGKLESEGQLLNGVVTGRHVAYTPDGKIFDDVTFEAGEVTRVATGSKDMAKQLAASDLKFIDSLEDMVLKSVR